MSAFGPRGGMSGGAGKNGKLSSETQKLLDNMMKDAGINHKKAQSLKQSLDTTGSLPSSLSSSSTSTLGTSYSTSTLGSANMFRPSNPRNSDRGRMSKAVIDEKIKRDPHRVSLPQARPGMDRDLEKERLASLMQYEGDVPAVRPREALNTRTKHYCPRGSNALADGADASSMVGLLSKRFAELSKEVEENQKFLSDMTKAGKAREYTAQINGTIAEKTREMREIDTKLSQL